MDIHLADTAGAPDGVRRALDRLVAALRAAGHHVTDGAAADAPAGASALHCGREAPASGAWLRWDHSQLLDQLLDAMSAVEDPPSAVGPVLTLGPWLPAPAGATGRSLPLAGIEAGTPRRPDGAVRIAIAGAAAHQDVANVRAACELAGRAGLDLVSGSWDEWPASTWDVLVCGPGAFADHEIDAPVQAMARGVPCLLPDEPALRAAAGNAALFCSFDAVDELAEALVLLARHPDLRPALGAAGRRWAAQHTDALAVSSLLAALPLAATPDAAPSAAPSPTVSLPSLPPAVAGVASAALRREATTKLQRALRDTAALYREAGDWADARAHLEAAAQLSGGGVDGADTELLDELAYCRFLAGDDAGALALYDLLLDTRHAEEVQESRGMVLLSQAAFGTAVEAFRAALEQGPPTAELHNNLGVALFHAGDREAASIQFRAALDLEPDHRDASANLAALG